MPAKEMLLEPPANALLVIEMLPLAAPVTMGSKLTWRANDCPGFNVAGKAPPEIAKDAPVSVTEFTVTTLLPDEVRVRVLLEVVLMFTLPKSMLLALSVS